MLPPFTPGKGVQRTVTTTATSYTFLGQGRQVMVYSASTLLMCGVGSAGITARAGSAGGGFYQTPLPPGTVQIFTRNPANDTKISLVAQTTTGKAYIVEGDGA